MRLTRWAVLVGLGLLGAAWMFATPPFAGPDEVAHYLRAATLADGHLLGPRAGPDHAIQAALSAGGAIAAEARWTERDRRAVFVKPAKSPPGGTCLDGAPDIGRGCRQASYTGDYLPGPYLLPAVAFAAAHRAGPALWWMRAGSLAVAGVFLALAVMFASRGGSWSLLGLLAAVTPMVLFISSVVNPNGLQICASLAFLAGLLDLGREPARFSRVSWIALTVCGAATVLAWQLGPVFAGLDLAIAALLGARAGLLTAGRSRGPLVAAAALMAAGAAFVAWAAASGLLHASLHIEPIATSLRAGREQFTGSIRGAIGNFGSYDVPLPGLMTLLWVAAVVAMAGYAAVVGTTRQRLGILAAGALAIVFPIAMYGFSYRYTGFGLQGRYILPVLALVPVVAGDIIAARSRRALYAARLIFVLAGAFELAAWWINARHWGGGRNIVLAHAAWRPPAGWTLWLVLACLGAASVALAGRLSPSEGR